MNTPIFIIDNVFTEWRIYMRLNTNISAIIANNALQKAQDRLSNSIQKLSSGYKINSSADDPAGCAISEKMRVHF